jgi:MFS family permease
MKKIYLWLALLTVIMQYYCYAIFGLSAVVLTQNFFESTDSTSPYIKFFAVFAVGSIARPLGATLLSIIGDKFGKTKALTLAGLMTSIANFGIAIMPGYTLAGFSAILGLTFCRMLMLASIGGELDGIRLYLTEKWPNKHYLISSTISIATQIGALLAAGAVFLSNPDLSIYHWRMNFIVGSVFGLFVLFLRFNFIESGIFIKYKKSDQYKNLSEVSSWSILLQNKALILLLAIINGCMGAGYHIYLIFFGVYLNKIINVTQSFGFINYNICAILMYIIGSVAAGIVTETIKDISKYIRYVVIITLALTLLSAMSISYNTQITIILNFITIFFMPFFSTSIPIYIQNKLAYGIRYRILSTGHSLGSITLSASSPLLVTLLYNYTKLDASPYLYFAILLIIMLLSLYYLESQLSNKNTSI